MCIRFGLMQLFIVVYEDNEVDEVVEYGGAGENMGQQSGYVCCSRAQPNLREPFHPSNLFSNLSPGEKSITDRMLGPTSLNDLYAGTLTPKTEQLETNSLPKP